MFRLFCHTLFISTLLVACSGPGSGDFVSKVQQAHAKPKFRKFEAIQFDLRLSFRGKERLNGTLTLLTNSGKGHIKTADGQHIYFIGDQVYASSGLENASRIRFDAYTWSYFFLFPYKMNDQGTIWSPYPQNTLNGKTYVTRKLTFERGTGDAPDDWYVVYADKETHLISTAAYIVTAGKTREKAEEDPHAISYENYQITNGVPIARQWTFWGWKENEGLTEQLGTGHIANVKFLDLPDDYFDRAKDLQEIATE